MDQVEHTGSEEVEQEAEPVDGEQDPYPEDFDQPPEEEEDIDDDTQPPEEEEVIPPSINGVNTPSETQTQQSDNQVKKTRGPTKMRKVAKHIEDKVEVEFNALGEHVGRGSVTLSSFLGPLVREHVSVLLDDWRHLEEKTKDALWEEIQGRFNLTEEWQKEVVFKQMGCLWRASKSRLSSLVRATKNKAQLQKIKPSNIQSATAWNNWVKGRCTTAFQVISTVSYVGSIWLCK
ncbi:hypothetical protein N665_0026s0054 [Sinapis alba]|nr:hypothetical protein N665_0026s0054 [Sinapis alba]